MQCVDVRVACAELLHSERLERADEGAERDEAQPVFFDVAGVWTVSVRAPLAAAAAVATLALVALDLRIAAKHARTTRNYIYIYIISTS